MAEWAPKRFWKEAQVVEVEGGFTVQLDGRAVKTPAKAALLVPTRAMAEVIAAEWDAQTDKINPDTMPAARAAHSAIDKLGAQKDLVVDMLAAYGETDLLCYRADTPPALVARQAAAWDPLLVWAAETLNAPLRVNTGIMPVAQDPQSLANLRAEVAKLDPFRLAAFHDLVAISGSLILALARISGRIDATELWQASRIDETFQAEEWGRDEEAEAIEARKRDAVMAADRFYGLCG